MRSKRLGPTSRLLAVFIALALILTLAILLVLRYTGDPIAIEPAKPASTVVSAPSSSMPAPRLIAQPEHCDIQLNFHGQEDDFLLAEYWHQRLRETLTPKHESPDALSSGNTALQFCAVLRHDSYTSDCPEQLGRAWCEPTTAENHPASNLNAHTVPQLHVVLTDSGLANTRNGVIYIKRNANVQVLQHELGHALGLADEYMMHPDLARQFCNGEFNFTASNLVITDKQWLTPDEMQKFERALPWAEFSEQPLATQDHNGVWRLGSSDNDKIGLFPAKTCEGTGLYAWKPVAEKTWMEQHEIGEIPPLYIQLIRQQLEPQ